MFQIPQKHLEKKIFSSHFDHQNSFFLLWKMKSDQSLQHIVNWLNMQVHDTKELMLLLMFIQCHFSDMRCQRMLLLFSYSPVVTVHRRSIYFIPMTLIALIWQASNTKQILVPNEIRPTMVIFCILVL